ncbi:MAG: hypothetical protein ACYS76_09415 [Planctomycetota bacterium]
MNEAGSEQQRPGGELASGKEDSCPPVPRKAGDKKNWNAAILILVLLLVGAVGAHSLLTVRRCRGRGGPYCGGPAVGGWSHGRGQADAVCPSEATCSAAEEVNLKDKGCPLYRDKVCPNSPGTAGSGRCPGGGYRWGRR